MILLMQEQMKPQIKKFLAYKYRLNFLTLVSEFLPGVSPAAAFG